MSPRFCEPAAFDATTDGRPKQTLISRTAAGVIRGRGDRWIVVLGEPDESRLLDVISGDKQAMPKESGPLSQNEVATLRR